MPPKPFGPGAILISLATLDVNGDGHPDLLAGFTRSDPFYSGRFVQVLVTPGTGRSAGRESAMRLPRQDDGLGWPEAIRVADLNGTGISTSQSPSTAPIGTSAVLPRRRHRYRQGQNRQSQPFFTFADVNADGHPDIASGLVAALN